MEVISAPQGQSRNIATYAQKPAQNVHKKQKCVKCNDEFNTTDDLNHHIRTSHRGSGSETLDAIMKIGQQLESVSQRLQFLEVNSKSNFPSMERGQQRI